MSNRRWSHYQFGSERVLKSKCADFVRRIYFMKEDGTPILIYFILFWRSGAYATDA